MATFKAKLLSETADNDFLNEVLTLKRGQKIIVTGLPQTVTTERRHADASVEMEVFVDKYFKEPKLPSYAIAAMTGLKNLKEVKRSNCKLLTAIKIMREGFLPETDKTIRWIEYSDENMHAFTHAWNTGDFTMVKEKRYFVPFPHGEHEQSAFLLVKKHGKDEIVAAPQKRTYHAILSSDKEWQTFTEIELDNMAPWAQDFKVPADEFLARCKKKVSHE